MFLHLSVILFTGVSGGGVWLWVGGGCLPLGPGVGVSAWLDTYPQVVRLFRIYFCRVRVHLHYIMDCTVLFSFCMFNLWRQSFLWFIFTWTIARHPSGPGKTPLPQVDTPWPNITEVNTPTVDTPPVPRDDHWGGRYASYWNAFLLIDFLSYIIICPQEKLRIFRSVQCFGCYIHRILLMLIIELWCNQC